MITSRFLRGGRFAALSEQNDRRIVRRSQLAGLGVLLVFAAVGAFLTWSSQVTSDTARAAVAVNQLSTDYDNAAAAVSRQDALDHEYLLFPSPEVRNAFAQQSQALTTALNRIEREGDQSDRATVAEASRRYFWYRIDAEQLFAAVDRRDTAAALLIHGNQVDPALDAVNAVIAPRVELMDTSASEDLAHVRRLETLNARLTPLVFLAGLLLTVIMALISGGQRRQLDAARAQAVHDSLHDELTGLPNRRLFGDRVDQALRSSRRSGRDLALLLIDLDRFKEVNDTLGHRHGDELLIQVGQRVQGALRRSDTVARLGGDEFAVLLPEIAHPRDADEVAAKLTAELAQTFTVHGVDLDIEGSIGVAAYDPINDSDADTVVDVAILLQRADQAMYLAKARNLGFVVYDPAADTHASPASLNLLGELRRALEREELLLHYQPKISVATGAVVGVEALVRWQHPTRGLIYPDAFIPVVEHTGLIGPLTLHVLDLALRSASAWAREGRALPIAVNLSARNLMDEHLPDQIADRLAAHGLPAALLHVEVTESAITLDPNRSLRILQQLAELGLRVSIDDFGAGYTSLAQLRDLPVDELKIDRSFVMTMLEDPANALIAGSVIELGHNLGLTIVAEGVETAEILAALAAIGCDTAQGYHVSRPLGRDDLTTWLRGRPIARPADLAAR